MWFWDRLRGTAREGVDRAAQPSNTGDGAYNGYVSTYDLGNREKMAGGFQEFVNLGYASSSVVFAVEQRRLAVFAEAAFKFRSLSDKRMFGTPELERLEHPWPNGSTGDLLSRMEQDATFAGNAYVRDAGSQLERLRPDWVTIVSRLSEDERGDQVREVIGYAYDPIGEPDRRPAFYPVNEVAHWAPIPDPSANFRGMSWLTPIIREINSDAQMSAFRDAFFANAATANLIVKYQNKVGADRIRALREMIDTRHTGSANAFGTLVFDEGGDPMVVGSDMAGAAFDALQNASEARIAAAGGVPALVAGLRDAMKSEKPGEYRDHMRAFVDVTMRPLWRSACASLEPLVNVPAGAQLWYDTTDVSALQQGEQDKATTMSLLASTINTLVMSGWTPESIKAAATAGDPSLLVHSGLISVQMQQLSAPKPGAEPTVPPGPPAAPPNQGG